MKKKHLGQFKKYYRTFYLKIFIRLSKVWLGIRDLGKNYSGSRIRGSKRHRIPETLRKKILLLNISTVHPFANRILPWRQTEASPFLPKIKKDKFLFTNYQITVKVKNGTRNRMCSWDLSGWAVPILPCSSPCLQRRQAEHTVPGTYPYLHFSNCNRAANRNSNRRQWTNERGVRNYYFIIIRR